jgi:hypothetical protein
VIDVRADHWCFGFAHDAWKVHTSRCRVESIDSMGLMPVVDARPLVTIDAVHA